MFLSWLAEGFPTTLTLAVPALLVSVAAGLLLIAGRRARPLIERLLSDRPSRLVVARVLLPTTIARGRAGRVPR
jgi:ABC-type amino acid transport system permease subunit